MRPRRGTSESRNKFSQWRTEWKPPELGIVRIELAGAERAEAN